MAAPPPSEEPKAASLYGIAQELRDEIYSHLIISDDTIELGWGPFHRPRLLCAPDEALQAYTALSRVSRKTRQEVIKPFWTSNRFSVFPSTLSLIATHTCLPLIHGLTMVIEKYTPLAKYGIEELGYQISVDLRKNGAKGTLEVDLNIPDLGWDRDQNAFLEDLHEEFDKDMEYLEGIVAGKTELDVETMASILKRCTDMYRQGGSATALGW